MVERIAQYMRKHGMASPGQMVLAGVSGGVDSVALLYVLCALRAELGFLLEAAHFNHGIRAESAEEQEFVREFCAGLSVPLHVGQADVPALARDAQVSLEVAARDARHAFFRDVMARCGADRLALAHHMDDQAETVLLRLFRGAGALGLGGMSPVEISGIIRPLLCVGREDILAYCAQNEIAWREDASNRDTDIPRNWVRHELLPLVRDRLNPAAAQALCRTAELLREDEQALCAQADAALTGCEPLPGGGVAVPIAALDGVPTAVRSRAVRRLAARAGMTHDFERAQADDVLNLLRPGMTGRRCDLGGGYTALREADRLAIVQTLPQAAGIPEKPLAVPGITRIGVGCFVCEVLDAPPADLASHGVWVQYFDLDALPEGIVVRSRRPGDTIYPLGAPGRRKLKEFFIDRKLSRWQRDAVPLIACGGEVLWAVGWAMAQSLAVRAETKRILKITYTGEDNQ